MNNPHGGKLINRQVAKKSLDLDNIDLTIELDNDKLQELRNIAIGLYSPLEGYLNQDDYNSVLEKIGLSNGLAWSIPLFLSLDEKQNQKIKNGSQILIKDVHGHEQAIVTVEDKYKLDKAKYNQKVYGTTDSNHPGVAMINALPAYAVGGPIWYFADYKPEHPDYDLTPSQTRELFAKNGWKTIVGFQTRNPAHMAHEYIQKLCLEFVDGLFINPIMGKKKSGDFKDEVILEVYDMLINQFYPKDSSTLAIYSSKMYYAGPREAVFHAIVRKNFGCTHFIVGRDHAGVGSYYDKFAAHRIFDQIENLDMQIMKVSAAFFDRRAKMFATEKTSPFSEIYRVSPSGTQVREFIKAKNYEALRQVMRDEVLDIIFKYQDPFVS